MAVAAATQKSRPLAIGTPLGDDRLMLTAFHGTESLGRLFQFELDLKAEGTPVAYGDILGKNVTVRLNMLGGKTRYFNGYISRYVFMGMDEADKEHGRHYYYRATLSPWLWFLSRKADCRIFQNKKVPDIIRQIFSEWNFSDVKDQLTGSYNPWVYCVQYRETDFNFISRLMENEGIYYYFEHENGKHTLVLCDGSSAHKPAEGYADLHFDKPDVKAAHDGYIWDWNIEQEIVPTQYALEEYNPLQPKQNLGASVNVSHEHDPKPYEIFDYPGGYSDSGEGRRYADVRLKELESQYGVGRGTTSARGVFAGATFKLQDHPAYDPEEYLVTAAAYQMENDDIGEGRGAQSSGTVYRAQLTCIPHKQEFRPQRITPKVMVQGPQTAVVVGPSGEEIHSNEHGEVKVKFFWDRDPKKDETSSCWVRVSQPSAGLGWGAINIPRIGQEVIVDFLEGDPDRPIITGRVYNGVNNPPYALPKNQTMTTFKSNSSKGGAGFNELRFEDKKGDEQIFVHGEKNLDIRVKNDRFETICNDRHLVVEKDKFEHVKNERHELVNAHHFEKIVQDRHLLVEGKEAKEVDGSQSLRVKGDVIEEFVSNHSEVTTKDYYLNADNIVIEANKKLTIMVGSNYIVIDSSGITVGCEDSGATLETKSQGDTKIESQMNANIKASMDLAMEAQANASLKASAQLSLQSQGMAELKANGMLSVQSSAVLSVQGSMVKIN